DPSMALPKGTLLAILYTTITYLLMAWFVGLEVVRDATGDVDDIEGGNFTKLCNVPDYECEYGLMNNAQIISMVSWLPAFVILGIFAATLSSALASLVGGPRIFQ
ncbi:solute carrier family 12 member 1-like, partial [Saccoglossus kowalevskii]|uniref:Solute carrier family 12 member 2-like n=1 Tax=Saccoglossus kowalevskii TaxID=10224 RepID=A0ABM0M192_SACKO